MGPRRRGPAVGELSSVATSPIAAVAASVGPKTKAEAQAAALVLTVLLAFPLIPTARATSRTLPPAVVAAAKAGTTVVHKAGATPAAASTGGPTGARHWPSFLSL